MEKTINHIIYLLPTVMGIWDIYGLWMVVGQSPGTLKVKRNGTQIMSTLKSPVEHHDGIHHRSPRKIWPTRDQEQPDFIETIEMSSCCDSSILGLAMSFYAKKRSSRRMKSYIPTIPILETPPPKNTVKIQPFEFDTCKYGLSLKPLCHHFAHEIARTWG